MDLALFFFVIIMRNYHSPAIFHSCEKERQPQ